MNKHQVTGRVEEAKGAIKEAAGKLVGNEKLQAEGAIEKKIRQGRSQGRRHRQQGEKSGRVSRTRHLPHQPTGRPRLGSTANATFHGGVFMR